MLSRLATAALFAVTLLAPSTATAQLATTKALTADAVKAVRTAAEAKARTSARFGRPSKVYADRITGNQLNLLSVDGVVALQGGLPIVVDGRVIGAVGVSGVTSAQDEEVAAAGIAAIKQ